MGVVSYQETIIFHFKWFHLTVAVLPVVKEQNISDDQTLSKCRNCHTYMLIPHSVCAQK